MKEKISALEQYITKLSADEGFIHHKWFIEHHLKIVEQLVNELCDLYPKADRDICLAMVWLHDLGKILTSKKLSKEEETRLTVAESRKLLAQLGFGESFIQKVVSDLEVFDQSAKHDLSKENIEIQIVSSADGCSHYIGPFMSIYWHENPGVDIATQVYEGGRKAKKDWERKITLPEARRFIEPRIQQIFEHDPARRQQRFIT
jgi:hypothetical protein